MHSSDQSILFVVGHERSGTSLVRAILDAHGGFSIPPTDADILLILDKEGEGDSFPRRKIENLINYEKLIPWNIDWLAIQSAIPGEMIECRELFQRILASFWRNHPGKRKAVKRPKYEHRIAQLRQMFPGSRFIALIRDPRAVLASKKFYGGAIGKNFNLGNILYIRLITSMIRWKLSVQCIRDAEKIHGREAIFVLKYEDIVNRPESALKEIFSFVQTDYNAEEIFSAIQKGFNSNSTFLSESKNKEIFRKDAIDRWKNKLNAVELRLIEKPFGAMMQQEGIILALPRLSMLQKFICSMNLLLYKLVFSARRLQA